MRHSLREDMLDLLATLEEEGRYRRFEEPKKYGGGSEGSKGIMPHGLRDHGPSDKARDASMRNSVAHQGRHPDTGESLGNHREAAKMKHRTAREAGDLHRAAIASLKGSGHPDEKEGIEYHTYKAKEADNYRETKVASPHHAGAARGASGFIRKAATEAIAPRYPRR